MHTLQGNSEIRADIKGMSNMTTITKSNIIHSQLSCVRIDRFMCGPSIFLVHVIQYNSAKDKPASRGY